MGTTKSRKSRRNNSRPTAFLFLSTIALGNEENDSISSYISEPKEFQFIENTTQPGTSSLHSSDSSFSADEENIQSPLSEAHYKTFSRTTPPVITETDSDKNKRIQRDDIEHHKLTREDSEKPIASEKIKKRSNHVDKDLGQASGLSIMSVFRYYTDKIRQSTNKRRSDPTINGGYVQQQLENQVHRKHRKAQSYARFLNSTGSLSNDEPKESNQTPYNVSFLDNDSYGEYGLHPNAWGTSSERPAEVKKEINEKFHIQHPNIPLEITLTKIRAIKYHLLEIAKAVDLEVSSLAHAFVYFEKLVIKNMVTKKNRKLIAACCLFLATKVNEAKGTWFKPLLESIYAELGIGAKEIHEHEFAVFADLEFDLYVPQTEFMPHFERILSHLETKCMQDYLGNTNFFEVNQRT